MERLIRSEFVKNSVKLISGTTLAQLIVIVSSPILSRLFTPENFGDLALYNSFIGIGVIIATGRFEMGLVVADSEEDATGLFQGTFFLAICFSLLSLALVLLNYFVVDYFKPAFWHFLLPVGLFFNAIFLTGNFYKSRKSEFGFLARGKILQTFSNVSISVGNGLLGLGSIGLICGNIIGFLLGAIYYFPRKILNEKTPIKSVLRRYSQFPKYNLTSGLMDTVSQNIPIFLFTHYFSLELTGHYSMAMKVLLLPLSMIGSSIGQVFFQKFTSIIRENRQNAKIALLKMWGTLFLIGIIPMMIISLYGTDIVIYVFGNQWKATGQIAQVLAPMLLAMFVSSPTSSGFIVLDIQKYQFSLNALTLIYRTSSLLIGAYYKDFLFGLQIWVIAELIQIFAFNIIMWRKI